MVAAGHNAGKPGLGWQWPCAAPVPDGAKSEAPKQQPCQHDRPRGIESAPPSRLNGLPRGVTPH